MHGPTRALSIETTESMIKLAQDGNQHKVGQKIIAPSQLCVKFGANINKMGR